MILKLLSYNICFGGRERQKQIAETINSIAPDTVVFQEASDPKVIENLSRECGMPHWGAREGHSVGFMSRLEIEYYEWHYPEVARHAFLEIQLAGSEARIFGLHLSARFSKWSERRRHREIQALLKSIERHQHGFHVLVGDFNTLAPGELFNLPLMPLWIRGLIWLSGNDIRRDTIQTILDAGYADGFRRLYPDDKGYTFPVWQPHVRLDYIFLPARYADCLQSCEVIKNPPIVTEASDHFPLLSFLEFEDCK
ncbi:MAG TPA: endonuclease/exonuclease/phosphatase family protein [Pyrinomonadaceae bacterium]|nr:endonuclease/exonuclease/phosphatase family protein [Pyrinomonadaceae bacterium]